MPRDLTLRVQSQDQGWQPVGVDRYRGVTPEAVKASANSWGSDLLSCILRRRPGAIFPDLASWTPCELEVGGVVVWDGRIKEAVEQDGASFQVGVVGAGWQYHLDDDTNEKVWVHTRLPDWRDQRSFLGADLTSFKAAGSVQANQGRIVIGFPANTTLAGATRVGVTLDLGPTSTAKRVVLTYAFVNQLGAFANFVVKGHDGESPLVSADANGISIDFGTGAASGSPSVSFVTSRRYVSVYIDANGTNPGAADRLVSISAIQVFNATAYESGNASILKTSDLVKDVLTWAALLSQDTSQIAATTFSWPEAAPFDEKSAREIIEAFNVAEQMQARVRVGKQLQYRAYPTAPLFEIGEWPGSEFTDQSSQSGQEVYNKVKIKGTGPDGSKLTIVRTQVGTIVDRFGFTRTKVLPVSMGLITALGNQLGDAFLAAHKTVPLKGDVTVSPGGARNVSAGGSVHPSLFLINTGEKLRLAHRADPDTGGWGRDGVIAQATYEHDTESAKVSLDNQRDRFEALLARLDAVIGAGSS